MPLLNKTNISSFTYRQFMVFLGVSGHPTIIQKILLPRLWGAGKHAIVYKVKQIHNIPHPGLFVLHFDELNELCDRMTCSQVHRTNINTDRIPQVFVSHSLDARWPSSTKQSKKDIRIF